MITVTLVGLLSVQLQRPQGPWDNDLMIRISVKRAAFGEERVFESAGGVPNVVADKKGKLYAVFQWFPETKDFDQVALKTSGDGGKTWSKPSRILVTGLPEDYQRPFDPTLAVTESGDLRLFFTSTESRGALPAIYSGLSSDHGKSFKFEPGPRLKVEGKRVIDSAAILHGKTWHLIAPIGAPQEGAYHAISKDGLKFTRVDDIPSVSNANWTGNLVVASKGICFYGTGFGGLWWSYSDDGKKWTDPKSLNIMGADPGVTNTAQGDVVIIYTGPPKRR